MNKFIFKKKDGNPSTFRDSGEALWVASHTLRLLLMMQTSQTTDPASRRKLTSDEEKQMLPSCRMEAAPCLQPVWTGCADRQQFSSVQLSCSVVSDSLRLHELQHARPPCPSPTPGVHSDSRSSSQCCHPAISSSVVPFFSCPQPLPASESFPMNQLFA